MASSEADVLNLIRESYEKTSTVSSGSEYLKEDDVEEAPILLTLLLTNQNNSANNAQELIDPRLYTLELLTSDEERAVDSIRDSYEKTIIASSVIQDLNEDHSEDALTLLLTNQNNNANYANQPHNEIIDPRSCTLELLESDKENVYKTRKIVDSGNHTIEATKPQVERLTTRLQVDVAEKQEHGLTVAQTQGWKENGYLVIPDVLSTGQLAEMTGFVQDHVQKIFSPQEKVKVHTYLPGRETYASPCGRAMVTLTDRMLIHSLPSMYQGFECNIANTLNSHFVSSPRQSKLSSSTYPTYWVRNSLPIPAFPPRSAFTSQRLHCSVPRLSRSYCR